MNDRETTVTGNHASPWHGQEVIIQAGLKIKVGKGRLGGSKVDSAHPVTRHKGQWNGNQKPQNLNPGFATRFVINHRYSLNPHKHSIR